MPVLVAILALTFGGTVAYDADNQVLRRVLDQWAIAWSSNDAERLLPLFTDNIVYEDVTFGAVNQGKTALRDLATATFGAFADLKFELKSRMVAADGKSGAMEWIWRGRQTKDFPGLPATNKPFEVRGATVVEFNDGKISHNSDYWDLATWRLFASSSRRDPHSAFVTHPAKARPQRIKPAAAWVLIDFSSWVVVGQRPNRRRCGRRL